MRVVWSETAVDSAREIQRVLNTVARDSGTRRLRLIRQAARDAAHFPPSRRIVPEIAEETIRETFSGPYRIWYRIHDSEGRIEVLVVFHGARQVLD